MTSSRGRRAVMWFFPAAVGLVAAGLLAAGFAAGLSGKVGEKIGDVPPAAPTAVPLPATGALRIVALGDSLTRGAGDTGGGYPERVAAAIRKSGRTVVVENLGVDGLMTDDLLKKVADPATTSRLTGAGVILVSISGNDLTRALPTPSGDAAKNPTLLALSRVSSNVRTILGAIRKANPKAPIRLLGLYDPFFDQVADRRLSRTVLLKWNEALEEASFDVDGTVVVPLADLFESRPDRLSSDRFHPGPQGDDEIAARLVSTLRLGPPGAV